MCKGEKGLCVEIFCMTGDTVPKGRFPCPIPSSTSSCLGTSQVKGLGSCSVPCVLESVTGLRVKTLSALHMLGGLILPLSKGEMGAIRREIDTLAIVVLATKVS